MRPIILTPFCLPLIHRFVWVLVILGAVSWLGFNVTNSFVQYLKFSKSTLVTVKYVTDLDFPVVTLCNFNLLRKSKLDAKTAAIMRSVFGLQGNFFVSF